MSLKEETRLPLVKGLMPGHFIPKEVRKVLRCSYPEHESRIDLVSQILDNSNEIVRGVVVEIIDLRIRLNDGYYPEKHSIGDYLKTVNLLLNYFTYSLLSGESSPNSDPYIVEPIIQEYGKKEFEDMILLLRSQLRKYLYGERECFEFLLRESLGIFSSFLNVNLN